MKQKIIAAVLVLSALTAWGWAQAPSSDSPGLVIERLAGLGRLWGLVKFCHPFLATRDIDWDEALIRVLPQVRRARSSEEYRIALERMLSALGDPATSIEIPPKEQAQPPVERLSPEKTQPFVEMTKDGIAVLVANDYGQFSDKTSTFIKMFTDFQKAFAEAAKSPRILVDLRNLGGEPSFLLAMTVPRFLPQILTGDVILPPLRFMSHQGYPSQREADFAYYSDLAVRSGGIIRAPAANLGRARTGEGRARLVILINSRSGDFYRMLSGLQDSGAAVVVHEGEPSKAAGVPTIRLDLAGGLEVKIRCAETLRKDGGRDFRPDMVVPKDAESAGLRILRGEAVSKPSRTRQVSSVEPGDRFSVTDRAYPGMTSPDADYRLLALFRFWAAINYFYPYKDLLDKPWDDVLTEFIPRMESAKDGTDYVMTVAELVSRIQDSHGTISSPFYSEYLGTASPLVRVDFIEKKTVITALKDPAAAAMGMEVGDTVLSVDGENVETRRGRLARYLPASTPGRLASRVDMFLLAGKPDRPARLEIRKPSGKILVCELVRSSTGPALRVEPPRLPVSSVLPEGFGYIDISQLREADVDPALEAVKGTRGLILDMRGYPVGGSFLLGQRLAKKRVDFARLQFPVYDGSSGSFSLREELQSLDPLPGKTPRYEGEIVVLVHGSTQSAAEHTCLILESVAAVTFIGSPSSGADGNITYAVLPGNIAVSFTGLGVRHGDGRPLQRTGILPQIRVEPTIAGVIAGRDEVLEAAVSFLRRNPERKKN